jgi:hypothetical protein
MSDHVAVDWINYSFPFANEIPDSPVGCIPYNLEVGHEKSWTATESYDGNQTMARIVCKPNQEPVASLGLWQKMTLCDWVFPNRLS